MRTQAQQIATFHNNTTSNNKSETSVYLYIGLAQLFRQSQRALLHLQRTHPAACRCIRQQVTHHSYRNNSVITDIVVLHQVLTHDAQFSLAVVVNVFGIAQLILARPQRCIIVALGATVGHKCQRPCFV